MSCRSALFNANSIYCSEYNRCDLKSWMKKIVSSYKACTGKHSGLLEMTGAYKEWQRLTVAHKGCAQWLTEDYRVNRGCVQGNDRKTQEKQEIFKQTGVFKASNVMSVWLYLPINVYESIMVFLFHHIINWVIPLLL